MLLIVGVRWSGMRYVAGRSVRQSVRQLCDSSFSRSPATPGGGNYFAFPSPFLASMSDMTIYRQLPALLLKLYELAQVWVVDNLMQLVGWLLAVQH